MDAALKARQLGSAAIRKQRIQERQVQQHLAHQQWLERKANIMIDTRPVEDLEHDCYSDASSIAETDPAAETPSEASVQTPEGFSLPTGFVSLSTATDKTDADMIHQGDTKSPEPSLTTEGVPKMQATLTTIADWNYDRFSIYMGPSDGEDEQEQYTEYEDDESSSSSEDGFEELSPIETATSVAYVMPTSKPKVISIATAYYQIKPLNVVKQRPALRTHVSDQILSDRLADGSNLDEYRRFHSHNISRETIGSSNNSSQVSRSVSLASRKDSIISQAYSQTSQSDASSRSPKRKSSLPLLFGANKPGHSKMSSIKKFIRSSTLGPPAPNQRSLSGATLETHFEDRYGSMEITRESNTEETLRPMTAAVRVPAPMFSLAEHMHVLPASSSTPVSIETASRPPSDSAGEDSRAKPPSKFRSRSGSIGQALKSIGNGPKKADPSAPPVPLLFVPPPPPFQSTDLGHISGPPPLTPRNPRRGGAGAYSPLPISHDRRSPTFPENNPFFEHRTSPAKVGLGIGLLY